MTSQPIRWGILATGNIARKFALGLNELPNAHLVAVASRNLQKAQEFASDFSAPQAYGSYLELAKDPNVEAIYVASPHPFHLDHTLLCLNHGKAVLCEKPLAVNAIQAIQMIQKAKEKDLFLMEAMWTRHLPVWAQIRRWLAERLIGEVRLLTADFSFLSHTQDPSHRRFNPELAGGALLDIGIYPLALAYMIFGVDPVEVQSTIHRFHTGVDETSAYLFTYANGAIASLTSSFAGNGTKEAVLVGTKGTIRVPLFWKAQELVLELANEEPQHHSFPYPATGLQFQAIAMMNDLRTGNKENDLISLDESLRIARMMDRLRKDWGLVYPFE